MEATIRKAVEEALAGAGASDVSFAVEWPAELSHGDFATNAALAAAKQLARNPKELAEELAASLRDSLGWEIAVAGPGFINMTLPREEITKTLVVARDEDWGVGSAKEGKRVAIEYSCPNPFKEMHIGHLMSTIIGESVARLTENAGAAVIRDSYGGDVGPHVAKALWALRKDNVTDVANAAEVDKAYAHGSRAYEESETAKVEIDALNQEIYKGEDQALMDLWRKCREVCLEAFREIYGLLDTKFDYYFFESEVTPIGIEIVNDGLQKGIFRESDGAIIYPGEEKGLHTLVFITSRGTPTYEAKDLGLAFYKEQRFESDEVIIETGSEQIGHFKVFLAALSEIAPTLAAKTSHISHGLLTLTTGKMSSRLGNTITASGLLAGVIEQAKEKNDDPMIAAEVAVGAIKYMILRQAAGSNVIFDPEKSLSLEGESGPYLQYALVRARSVLAQAGKGGSVQDVPSEPYTLERLITRFPEVAARAERERAPHHVAQYLTLLASEWNSFYAQERIIGGEHEAYKLLIAEAFAATMANGLRLLAIPTPKKM
ncbi:MAG TPA: arginine--tRNA ligase [Candidatus Paceibacterota bacterium]|nr:arginine--tRNA ligase [Candidatus Paceibacterota bacterium]